MKNLVKTAFLSSPILISLEYLMITSCLISPSLHHGAGQAQLQQGRQQSFLVVVCGEGLVWGDGHVGLAGLVLILQVHTRS